MNIKASKWVGGGVVRGWVVGGFMGGWWWVGGCRAHWVGGCSGVGGGRVHGGMVGGFMEWVHILTHP